MLVCLGFKNKNGICKLDYYSNRCGDANRRIVNLGAVERGGDYRRPLSVSGDNRREFANCNIKSKSGVSMVIAVALVSLTSIIALSIYTVALSRVGMEQKLDGNYKAKSMANSALSLAQSRLKSVDAGFMQDWLYMCFNPEVGSQEKFASDEADCDEKFFKFKIESRATQIDDTGNYFVPPIGQGSAGENCKYSENKSDPAMPCNWNRIKYGETVAIPLYTSYIGQAGNCANGGGSVAATDPSVGTRRVSLGTAVTEPFVADSEEWVEICNPVDLGLSSFTIRFRTPCEDEPSYDENGHLVSNWSSSCSRPSLQQRSGGNTSERSDVVVHWQVVGECDYADDSLPDGQCSGVAVDGGNVGYGNWDFANVVEKLSNDLLIQDNENGDVANGATGYINLIQFVTNGLKYALGQDYARTITKPTLQISVVSPLTTLDSRVPYLEYQIETNAPISDSNYTLYSVGKFNDFVESSTKKIPVSNAQLDLVLQN